MSYRTTLLSPHCKGSASPRVAITPPTKEPRAAAMFYLGLPHHYGYGMVAGMMADGGVWQRHGSWSREARAKSGWSHERREPRAAGRSGFGVLSVVGSVNHRIVVAVVSSSARGRVLVIILHLHSHRSPSLTLNKIMIKNLS